MKLRALAAMLAAAALLSLTGCGSASPNSPSAVTHATRSSDPAIVSAATTTRATHPSHAVGPAKTLSRYWQEMASHHFPRAWSNFAPRALDTTEAEWVSGERATGLEAARFTGSATISGRAATVEVGTLVLHTAADGCQRWTGTYDLVRDALRWRITRANISPHRCSSTTKPATAAAQQPAAATTSTTASLNCNEGGFAGTLVGASVCQYEIGSQVVEGPAGAYLEGDYQEAVDPCQGTIHDAHWSNGTETTVTQPSYQQQNGECG